MKLFKSLLLYCIVLCGFATCSCSKMDKAADGIVGSYVLDEALWLGESEFGAFVDLDGDGKSRDRIDLELQRYNALGELTSLPFAGAVTSPDNESSGSIWLRIPLQDLQKDGDGYLVSGAAAPAVGFEYELDSSGAVRIAKEVDYDEVLDFCPEQYVGVNSAKILGISDGLIELTAFVKYYDFNVDRILTGPVRLIYRRI